MELSELRRHRPEIGARRSPVEGPPEAAGRVGAQIKKAIRGQSEDVERRCIGRSVRKPELMGYAIDQPEPVPTVCGMAQIETIEMRERDDGFCFAFIVLGG